MNDFRCTCSNERIDNRPQFIVDSRGQGKTTLLIKQASETNGVIVCPSRHIADHVFHMARDLGYSIERPITYDEFSFYFKGARNKEFYFYEYRIQLESIIRQALDNFEHSHVKAILIDEDSISRLNDILDGLKVCDMDGKKLILKIEIFEED